MLENVIWHGHACVQVKGSRNLYVDPFQLKSTDSADMVLITHDHYDHLSSEDLEKIVTEETEIIVPKQYVHLLEGKIHGIEMGQELVVQDVKVKAVPAYNPGKQFHPKEKLNVGYIFQMDAVTYYHAGDSDFIPEMQSVQADVAFLPVGGTYTMNADEAAKATHAIQPKVAIPIHWGSIVGSKTDADRFKSLCNCPVQILEEV